MRSRTFPAVCQGLSSGPAIGFCFLLVSAAFAGWEPDIRLTVNDSSSRTSYNNARCVAACGDTVHAVWFDNRAGLFGIYDKRSPDRGATWGADTCLASVSYAEYPSIAASGSDLHLAWEDYRDGNFETYYKHSSNCGATWDADRRLTVNSA